MKQYILNEDERLPRLFVRFSPEISKQIDDIYVYNPNNIRGLFEWRTRIDWLIEYISN